MNHKTIAPKYILAFTLLISTVAAAPVANFTVNPQEGEAPLQVKFNASSSHAPNSTITNYYWDLTGDGEINSEKKVAEYTYFSFETFQTSLTVEDKEGREHTTYQNIKVKEPDDKAILKPEVTEIEEGYGYFEALAGRYINETFTCKDTEVSVEIDGITYSLGESRDGYCYHSREIRLSPGTHNATFRANYPEETKEEHALVKIKGKEPKLTVYSPTKNLTKMEHTELLIEAQATRGGIELEGNYTAHLNSESVELTKTSARTYSGKINVGKQGNKTLNVTFQDPHEQWKLQKQFNIEVTPEGGELPRMTLLYPTERTEIHKNDSLPMGIELIGKNGLPKQDEVINYTIKRYGDIVDQGKMHQQHYLYTKSHKFSEAGEHTIEFKWENIKREIGVRVGPEEEIPEEKKLQINTITPKPSIYEAGNDIIILTVLTKQEEFIDGANVSYIFNKKPPLTDLTPEGGEYTGVLTNIPKGRNTLTIKAEYDGETARETFSFQVTDNYLQAELKEPSPDETINVSEGIPITLTAKVIDQNNVPTANAEVEMYITTPTGKRSKTTATQQPGGIYESHYYPDTTGEHEIKIASNKPNYVPDETTETIQIQIEKEETKIQEIIAGTDIELLFKVALGLAIVILLLAIMTRAL